MKYKKNDIVEYKNNNYRVIDVNEQLNKVFIMSIQGLANIITADPIVYFSVNIDEIKLFKCNSIDCVNKNSLCNNCLCNPRNKEKHIVDLYDNYETIK